MEKTITPSEPITEGQIGKLKELLNAKLQKHKAELPSNLIQQVLGIPELAGELFAVIRKRVEAISNMIIRVVKVNRNRSAKEALKATGRNQYVDDSVLKTIPKGETEETEVIFFKIGRQISMDDLEKEYALRGLKPADPYSQAAVNEADPAFADEHPNGTQWKDGDGKWCYAVFRRDVDERDLSVRRYDGDWGDYWWFAGVRK
jgi:hypothetical protein